MSKVIGIDRGATNSAVAVMGGSGDVERITSVQKRLQRASDALAAASMRGAAGAGASCPHSSGEPRLDDVVDAEIHDVSERNPG